VLDHFNKALSTLLIGNNIMHIGTASLATYLVVDVLQRPDLTTFCTLLTTVVVFLVAEMIPKQFAKDCPEATALAASGGSD
jgi:Mg2+/Co2+ transporter CorB